MNRICRALSTTATSQANGGRIRRTWKPYYNNRHGYQRGKFKKGFFFRNLENLGFEKYRVYYEKETDRHVQGAQLTTPGLDRDHRVRHAIYQAPNKWESFAEKKERLINQPELHPALDHHTPDYSFASGQPAAPSR